MAELSPLIDNVGPADEAAAVTPEAIFARSSVKSFLYLSAMLAFTAALAAFSSAARHCVVRVSIC